MLARAKANAFNMALAQNLIRPDIIMDRHATKLETQTIISAERHNARRIKRKMCQMKLGGEGCSVENCYDLRTCMMILPGHQIKQRA